MKAPAATLLAILAIGLAGADLVLHLRSEAPQIANHIDVPPFQTKEPQIVVQPAKIQCPEVKVEAPKGQGALTQEQLNLLLRKIEELSRPQITVAPSTVRPYMWCAR